MLQQLEPSAARCCSGSVSNAITGPRHTSRTCSINLCRWLWTGRLVSVGRWCGNKIGLDELWMCHLIYKLLLLCTLSLQIVRDTCSVFFNINVFFSCVFLLLVWPFACWFQIQRVDRSLWRGSSLRKSWCGGGGGAGGGGGDRSHETLVVSKGSWVFCFWM